MPDAVVETHEEWGVIHDLAVGEPSKWNYPLDAMRYAKANNMTLVRRIVTTTTLASEWEPATRVTTPTKDQP